MAFTNLYNLGVAVDLFFSADGVSWSPIADLPSGTVTVSAAGVIQCRGLPENVDNAGVGYIKAVPVDPNYGDAAVRVKVDGLRIPFSTDDLDFSAGVVDQATPISYTSYVETDDGSEVSALTPETVELGTMDAHHDSGDPGVFWGYVENSGA